MSTCCEGSAVTGLKSINRRLMMRRDDDDSFMIHIRLVQSRSTASRLNCPHQRRGADAKRTMSTTPVLVQRRRASAEEKVIEGQKQKVGVVYDKE